MFSHTRWGVADCICTVPCSEKNLYRVLVVVNNLLRGKCTRYVTDFRDCATPKMVSLHHIFSVSNRCHHGALEHRDNVKWLTYAAYPAYSERYASSCILTSIQLEVALTPSFSTLIHPSVNPHDRQNITKKKIASGRRGTYRVVLCVLGVSNVHS